jgi:hypothetical protein
MVRSHLVFAVAVVIAFGGCSSVHQTLNGWFGEAPPAATPVVAREGQTYYSALDGLTVYAQASASSKVVGHLTLHERITRSRIERGYAYIVADTSGVEGWVDNAQLLWRLPAAGAASKPDENEPANEAGHAPAAEGAAQATEAEPSESPPAEPTPTSTPVVQPATPTTQAVPPTPQVVPPTPQAVPPRPASAIFDPF